MRHCDGEVIINSLACSPIGRFLRFALLSGIGWLCDFGAYSVLVELASAQPYVANFGSSFVGVTFVYLTSLRFVFGHAQSQAVYFMLVYWLYHFASITVYSGLLHLVIEFLVEHRLAWSQRPVIEGKLLVTPLNLVTNFAFMSLLGRYMRPDLERS